MDEEKTLHIAFVIKTVAIIIKALARSATTYKASPGCSLRNLSMSVALNFRIEELSTPCKPSVVHGEIIQKTILVLNTGEGLL